MIKKIYILFFFKIFFFVNASAQNVEQEVNRIKQQRDKYIFGEASGETLEEADEQALYLLISQISLSVESKYESVAEYGNNTNLEESVKSVVKTYSSATLNSAERIVLADEPNAKVLRFIKRTDIDKIFKQRENKINEFVNLASKYSKEHKIGDALRYFYWGLQLLKSHPDQASLVHTNSEEKLLLTTFIPAKINEIFDNLRIGITNNTVQGNFQTVEATITHKGIPVHNLEYKYWTGRDWTSTMDAKDGLALFEFKVIKEQKKNTKIKIEYAFKQQAQMDNEIEEIMKVVKRTSFNSKATMGVDFNVRSPQKSISISQTLSKGKLQAKDLKKGEKLIQLDPCVKQLKKVLEKLQQQNFADIYPMCSENGKNVVKKLLAYGNVKVLNSNKVLKAYQQSNILKVYAVPMRFDFKTNTQKFIENVVFHFNNNHQIVDITFGLSNSLVDEIDKKPWPEADKLTLTNFLEHYKTAYALKRLSYIESIYSDDALIITGVVLKREAVDASFKDNKVIKYNKQSKAQYMKNLSYSFSHKAYVNLKFEDISIRRGSGVNSKYGLRLKQYYYSSNYADKGYLFLMADLADSHKPIIHVRTWQEKKDVNGRVFNMGDF